MSFDKMIELSDSGEQFGVGIGDRAAHRTPIGQEAVFLGVGAAGKPLQELAESALSAAEGTLLVVVLGFGGKRFFIKVELLPGPRPGNPKHDKNQHKQACDDKPGAAFAQARLWLLIKFCLRMRLFFYGLNGLFYVFWSTAYGRRLPHAGRQRTRLPRLLRREGGHRLRFRWRTGRHRLRFCRRTSGSAKAFRRR